MMNDRDNSRSDDTRDLIGMATAVGLSVLGMAFHTVHEFGYAGLLAPGTGMIPVAGVQAGLFLIWWLVPSARVALGLVLALTGVFQLLGGAIISVLPLTFLPFEPEQSVGHYLSHLVLGITQLPLIVLPLRQAGRRGRGSGLTS